MMAAPASLLTILDSSLFPVANALCTFLDISDLINLARTCKKIHHVFGLVQRSQWSINKRLGYFVNDPIGFRSMIGQCEALISGSFALGFLDRVFWDGSDLDIYLGLGDWKLKDLSRVRALGLYLIQKEAYRFLPTSNQDPDFEVAALRAGPMRRYSPDRTDEETLLADQISQEPYGRAAVFTFIYRDASLAAAKKIQIIGTEIGPLQHILGFHSTTVMNFITWNKAYSLFPWTTFVLRIGVVTKTITAAEARCLEKYSERGWRHVPHVLEVDDNPLKNPVRSERCVTDTFSWVVPLDTSDVAKPDTPDHVIELSSWQCWTSNGPGAELLPTLCTSTQLFSNIFRHQYLCADECAKFVIKQIRGLQHVERMKLIPKGANNGWHWPSAWYFPHVLPRPAGYSYWDDYFPKFYRLYLEKEKVQIKLQRKWDGRVGGVI